MYIHGYEDSEISMDIHGYPPKNGLDMDMDMDAIFHLHGKPGRQAHIFIYIQSNLILLF